MKVLVTGAEGYLGIPLTQRLIAEGHRVVGLDTGFFRTAWLYQDNIRLFPPLTNKDVRDVSVADLQGFDAIIHLAELSNDPLGQINEEVTFDINHRGTTHLAQTAKAAGVSRFIYFSSCSVYGSANELLSEESATNPLTAYAKCKILNEQMLLKLADKKFTPVIMRNATAYGASPRMRFDLVVNNLAGLAHTTQIIKMESDGRPWRPFVHVQDIAQAACFLLKAPKQKVGSEIFNIGAPNSNYQIKDIAQAVAKVFPNCQITLNAGGVDKRNYRVDFSKIHRVLPQFTCRWTVEAGVRELQQVFEKIDLDATTFQSKEYTRLKQIKYLGHQGLINERFFWS